MSKKRNTALFIDGENISANMADMIIKKAKNVGVVDTIKVYGLQNDKRTKKWSKIANTNSNMKDIRLYGKPSHNKVDNKIKKDTIRDVKNTTNVDIVIIASSDHGYIENIKELRAMGKRVVGIGEEKAPKNLRDACNEYIII